MHNHTPHAMPAARHPEPASHSLPGDYATPADRSGALARLCPTAAFYARVAAVVLTAAHRARRGAYGDAGWIDSSMRTRAAFERVGARLSITGVRHYAGLAGPCVVIGNHMSTAETFLLPGILQLLRPIAFVVKQSLVEYPIFKHVMRSRDPIVVGRVNPREDLKAVLEGGQQRLQAGCSVVIFPQRTRTVQFDREAFNTIGVKLARRAGVPVIPLALRTDAWSNGRWLKDFGRIYPDRPVRIAFGEPLSLDAGERPVHAAVIAFIESHLLQWGLAPAAPAH